MCAMKRLLSDMKIVATLKLILESVLTSGLNLEEVVEQVVRATYLLT